MADFVTVVTLQLRSITFYIADLRGPRNGSDFPMIIKRETIGDNLSSFLQLVVQHCNFPS